MTCDECPFSLLCLGGRLVPETHIACFGCGLVRERDAGKPHVACGNLDELLLRNRELYQTWLNNKSQIEQLAHFGILDYEVLKSWVKKTTP